MFNENIDICRRENCTFEHCTLNTFTFVKWRKPNCWIFNMYKSNSGGILNNFSTVISTVSPFTWHFWQRFQKGTFAGRCLHVNESCNHFENDLLVMKPRSCKRCLRRLPTSVAFALSWIPSSVRAIKVPFPLGILKKLRAFRSEVIHVANCWNDCFTPKKDIVHYFGVYLCICSSFIPQFANNSV